MISEKINEMVNEEVGRVIGDKIAELDEARKHLCDVEEKTRYLDNDNYELNQKVRSLSKAEDLIAKFTPLVNKDNFEDFLDSLNLEGTGIVIDGMDSGKIPVWFQAVVKYYDHKELVISLMNLFNIDYPNWAANFKLPYDYNEEELDLFFRNISYASVTNGADFQHNTGFFYEKLKRNNGDVKLLLTKSDYFNIPWNLLLQNKLLVTGEYFNKILNELKENSMGYMNSFNFFYIQKYQELSSYQVSQMLDLLPEKRLMDCHRAFINQNVDIFKIKPELVNRFLNKISDNQFSTFYYLNYPVEIQKDYVKDYTERYGYRDKFEMVKKMDISKEDKIKLLSEIAEMELGESED
ncbi:hypothetical protein CIL05_07415 [Virgibacillus profundi]|uniref:Uncharacterized protein n=1 Tax=Virgibacillus profundi TaxID=2024555 RepID=A0A2A2IEW7_9BACI|nr:hypothetical protein [Virgibacillus profundi]PAV30289.1 hypothetical protein CIL05_07415 [Virgibacillus profundi]PXY54461.1 hypothetical protein CIT14_07500 [Virgibacillus profundi]